MLASTCSTVKAVPVRGGKAWRRLWTRRDRRIRRPAGTTPPGSSGRAPSPFRANGRKALAKLHQHERAGRGDLFYGDESGFCLQPTLTRGWQPPAPPLSLPAQAHSKGLESGRLFTPRRRTGPMSPAKAALGAEPFVEAVETRLWPVLRRPGLLGLDHGPCHRNRLVKARRAAWRARGLRLLFLPPSGVRTSTVSKRSGDWSSIAGSRLPLTRPLPRGEKASSASLNSSA